MIDPTRTVYECRVNHEHLPPGKCIRIRICCIPVDKDKEAKQQELIDNVIESVRKHHNPIYQSHHSRKGK